MAEIAFHSRIVAVLVVLVLFLPLISAVSYQEGIHLIRPDSQYISKNYPIPEYLTVEDITFVSCLEEEIPLRNSLLCLDDNSFEDLDVVLWAGGDNCYLSSYNLEDFECERLLIQAEYTKDGENLRMTKLVRVNKLSKVLDQIIDTQYSDGGWRDPLSTAYGVWALSYFKDIYEFELDLALDWLKLNRNEEAKCWPKSPCNVEISSNILALLTLSNYTDARRVVNDARNWFEELQNDYKSGDQWNLSIYAPSSETTLTLVGYEREVLDENFTIPLDGSKHYLFDAEYDRELTVISDDTVIANISDQDNKLLISYQGDNLSYLIPGNCWSLNRKGEVCDDTTSMFALMTPIEEDNKELARDWARANVEDWEILGKYFGDDESILDTALFLYNIYGEDSSQDYIDEVIDFTLYRQNNEGSWDDGSTEEKVVPTAFAVLALLDSRFNRSSEPVNDAEEWVSDNEYNITANNTIALASAFYILKHNARPLLTSIPKIIYVDKPSIELQLFNPTTFNLEELTYEFSNEIKDYVTIEEKEEIDSYSYRRVTVSRTEQAQEDIFGYLDIANLGDPVARIPVVLTDTPIINISVPDSVTVFGRNGQIPVKVQKTSHNFVCTMVWSSSDISSPGSIKISSINGNIPVSFNQALTREDVYSGDLICKAMGKETTLQFSIYLQRFADIPLSISPSDVLVNSTTQNVLIELKNNIDRDLNIRVSMDRYEESFSFRNTVLLSPNEAYNLTLINELPKDLNLTSSVLIQFDVLNRTEVVSMLIDIEEYVPTTPNMFMLLLPYTIILIVILILAYFFYRFRDIIFKELNKLTVWKVKAQKREESKKIKDLKSDEKQQAISNLYKIMKLRNKDDKEIAQSLLAKFSREEIQEALVTIGAALPDIDEEEPEKIE